MENEIILNARYGYKHKLKHICGTYWQFESDPKSYGTYRLIGDEHGMAHITALDPDGGPFMEVGSIIEGKVIKSISHNGVFELE